MGAASRAAAGASPALLLGQRLGVGQHQLDAVLLVDLGGAGVVVDSHHIAVRVVVLQLADHALAHDGLGRQPKGWVQTMLGVPVWMSSSISAVRSQPSPILLPSPR